MDARTWNAVLLEHQAVAEQLADAATIIDAIATHLIDCLQAGGKILVAGNGGSAADAQHIAAELLGRFKVDRPALAAVALTTDTSTLTAVGNDLGYDAVFARQIQGLANPRDTVWLLSTSGNSPNVIQAADAARNVGAKVVGFTGAGGGKLAELCDLCFAAPHTASDRIQEAHLLAYHYLCERVEAAFT